MRPTLSALGLLLGLWSVFSEAQGRGAATDTNFLMSQCLTNESNNQIGFLGKDDRDDCHSLDSQVARNACTAERRDNSANLRQRCLESVKSKCAMVNFDRSKIIGCEQFASATSEINRLDGDLDESMIPDEPEQEADARSNTRSTAAHTTTTQGKQTSSNSRGKSNSAANESARNSPSPSATLNPDRCYTAQQRARQCCGNPASCVQAQTNVDISAGGVRSSCRQLKKAGLTTAQINNQAASACYSSYSSCQEVCGSLASKYRASSDQESASELEDIAHTCSGYSAVVSALGQQATETTDVSDSSDDCELMAKATSISTPNVGAGGAPVAANPFNFDSSFNGSIDQYCALYPQAQACKGSPPTKPRLGSGAFREAPKSSDSFNLMDNSDEPVFPMSYGASNPSTPPTVETVPNNSGGGLASSGGEPDPYDFPSQQRTKPDELQTTDILDGFRSGGGYSYGGREGSSDGQGAYAQGRLKGNRRPASEDGGYLGYDLRKFLPGFIVDMLPESWKRSSRPRREPRLAIPCVDGTRPTGCNPNIPSPEFLNTEGREPAPFTEIGARSPTATLWWLVAGLTLALILMFGLLIWTNLDLLPAGLQNLVNDMAAKGRAFVLGWQPASKKKKTSEVRNLKRPA